MGWGLDQGQRGSLEGRTEPNRFVWGLDAISNGEQAREYGEQNREQAIQPPIQIWKGSANKCDLEEPKEFRKR